MSKVPPAPVLVPIEVSDSTLKFDHSSKADLYARLGVCEYWTVNAPTLETYVHRPSLAGYRSMQKRKSTALLKPHLLPGMAIRLKELGINGV